MGPEYRLELEEDSDSDCDPLQIGLARLFCDLHCVRDAVVRGDREVIRNLERATHITNENMEELVTWSHNADRAEFEYLDEVLEIQSGEIKDLTGLIKGTNTMVNGICNDKKNPAIVC